MLEAIQNTAPKIPELVMQEMISAMEDGRLRVGEELPAERDLAKMLGISRTSLRECLAVLEFQGVIERPGYRKIIARGADYIRNICVLVQTFGKMDWYDHAALTKRLA